MKVNTSYKKKNQPTIKYDIFVKREVTVRTNVGILNINKRIKLYIMILRKIRDQIKKVVNNSEEDEQEGNRRTHYAAQRPTWYKDFGPTCHMSYNKGFFEEINYNINEDIYFVDGTKLEAKGIGSR